MASAHEVVEIVDENPPPSSPSEFNVTRTRVYARTERQVSTLSIETTQRTNEPTTQRENPLVIADDGADQYAIQNQSNMALGPPPIAEQLPSNRDTDVQSMLREWYKSEHWRNLPLLWLKGDFVNLEAVYTHLDIEGTTTDDYRSLFLNEAKRILIEGEAGIGKSTFLKKVALDWANGQLPEFDHVFAISMRAIEEEQKLEEMIVQQSDLLRAKKVHPDVVHNILEQDSSRTLIVCDGLDEMCSNSDIQQLLQRHTLWDTYVIVTTRPHSSEIEEIRRLMGRLAKIKGFTDKDAKLYILRILEDKTKLKSFMEEVRKNNLGDFLKVPFIALALSLVYLNTEPPTLPTTMTAIYEKLVECFVKNCGNRSDLSPEETQAAMDELADLAFNGLMRKTKQLIFKSEEISLEVYELGLLSGQRQRRRLDPGMIIEFPHKSVQEYMASKSAVRRLNSPETDEDPLRFLDTVKTTSDIYNWKLLLQFICGQGSKTVTDRVVHKSAEKCIDVYAWADKHKENILFSVDHYLEDLVKESSVVQTSLAHCNKVYLSHKCVQHRLPSTLRFVPRLICLMPIMELLDTASCQGVMSSIPKLAGRDQSHETILHVGGFQMNQETLKIFTEWITAIPHLNYIMMGFVDIHPEAAQDVETCQTFTSNIVQPSTKILVLNNNTFPVQLMAALLSNLSLNTEMNEFRFIEGKPNHLDWKALPAILQFQCPEKVEDLTLENLHLYQMTDEARESDMLALGQMVALRSLNLSHVSFRTSGFRLAEAMSRWPREILLRKLDLTKCHIQNDPAREMSKVIANCRHLQNLTLMYNNFHHCASIIFAVENQFPQLRFLHLDENEICGEDLVAVGNAMLEGNVPLLKEMSFSDIKDATEDDVHHLLSAIDSQPHREWRIDLGRSRTISQEFRRDWHDKLKRINHLRF